MIWYKTAIAYLYRFFTATAASIVVGTSLPHDSSAALSKLVATLPPASFFFSYCIVSHRPCIGAAPSHTICH